MEAGMDSTRTSSGEEAAVSPAEPAGSQIELPADTDHRIDMSDQGKALNSEEGPNIDGGFKEVPCKILKPPFPGGPENDSVINSFTDHIAHKIWIWDPESSDRLLKVIHHGPLTLGWDLDLECKLFVQKVEDSGLANLARYSYFYINRYLVNAFVERWYPETNTFHLPFGEMTITLDDVKQILDIPIRGTVVMGPALLKMDESVKLLKSTLGLTEDVIIKELKECRGNSVRFDWLYRHFHEASEDAGEEKIDCAVRAFLLNLIGCTLFSDKTGNRVSVAYLRFFSDLTRVKEYAWGVAGLTFLYKQLGMGTRYKVKQICGYVTLLEAWIYEHFNIGASIEDIHYKQSWPRLRRWIPKSLSGSLDYELQRLREYLDKLSPRSVIWDPYKDARKHHAFDDVSWYRGRIISFNTLEAYNIERVLRQFGRTQRIPRDPHAPSNVIKGVKKYKSVYTVEESYWKTWVDQLLDDRSTPAINPWDCSHDYMEWYMKVSHPQVLPPGKRNLILKPRIVDDWKAQRDAALNQLKESFALGPNQDPNVMFEREKKIYKLLCFDNEGEATTEDVQDKDPRAQKKSEKGRPKKRPGKEEEGRPLEKEGMGEKVAVGKERERRPMGKEKMVVGKEKGVVVGKNRRKRAKGKEKEKAIQERNDDDVDEEEPREYEYTKKLKI